MPEFRFRRKKQQNRRKTVHDVEESAKQIEAATKNSELTNKPEKRSSIGSVQPHQSEVGVAGQKVGMKEQEVPPPIPPKVNRSSLVQEREKFFELLRSKYPEQASNLEMMADGDQNVKVSVMYVCSNNNMHVPTYYMHAWCAHNYRELNNY